MRIFLLRLWPVLLPFLLYLVWIIIITRRARDGRPISEHLCASVRFWTILSSFMMVVVSLLLWRMADDAPQTSGRYVPAHMQDGQLVPAHVEPDVP
ncbi:MAG: hypothetical protein EAZ74_06275 [Alphaproteobacteria bacterium]|nr:MAG: hypothetical protein EAY76_05220 [Alphaproteobacteria bacterium]TAF13200.1 MAG: hypothetical protein EAZ74_06275 [Alphaproteobacteria bacterium]TAF40232.1 MAG: hypothetical protein EAZ66_03530 [Alphaproteobacteria bacterium]TAF77361.1 MAG: hypothetical protein EAZ52_00675 [Alphaproteobacteria bacterium]